MNPPTDKGTKLPVAHVLIYKMRLTVPISEVYCWELNEVIHKFPSLAPHTACSGRIRGSSHAIQFEKPGSGKTGHILMGFLC